ncbi:MAG TPA: hypothetical protein VK858_02740 [Longimicrobiales bacterium]|nr:hypothetical protein [Longimicrobiales bacterium]
MTPDPPPSRHKPTPVRQALPGDARRPEVRFEGRALELDDGTRLWVEELGWGQSGRREDPGSVLLLLGFRAEDADGFDREALVPARRLAELSREALLTALESAGRFKGVPADRPFFGEAGRRSRERRGRRGPSRSD